MNAVCKISALLTITLALLAGAPSRGLCAAAGCEWPLEIVNESGAEITSLRISQTGMEKWSDNRAPSPIPDGGRAELDIERGSILGLCDVEITADGRSTVWRRLPILEIFSVTIDEKFEPHYERIKLGA